MRHLLVPVKLFGRPSATYRLLMFVQKARPVLPHYFQMTIDNIGSPILVQRGDFQLKRVRCKVIVSIQMSDVMPFSLRATKISSTGQSKIVRSWYVSDAWISDGIVPHNRFCGLELGIVDDQALKVRIGLSLYRI